MEKKGLIVMCGWLLDHFASLQNNEQGVSKLIMSWKELIGYKEFQGEKGNLELIDFVMDAWSVAFSFGFTIGQMVDLTKERDRITIGEIKDFIRDNGLLPYLPHEKKAA